RRDHRRRRGVDLPWTRSGSGCPDAPRTSWQPVTGRTARSVTRLRVRYADTDAMGIAYYANYFVWFEVARTDLLRTLGWSYRAMEDAGTLLPVIAADCRYRRPARYDDELEIRTEGR